MIPKTVLIGGPAHGRIATVTSPRMTVPVLPGWEAVIRNSPQIVVAEHYEPHRIKQTLEGLTLHGVVWKWMRMSDEEATRAAFAMLIAANLKGGDS